VKHEQKIDCGGGYIKLYNQPIVGKDLKSETEYAIMFGPDICGPTNKKTHVVRARLCSLRTTCPSGALLCMLLLDFIALLLLVGPSSYITVYSPIACCPVSRLESLPLHCSH
jgi:calreticulin family protein